MDRDKKASWLERIEEIAAVLEGSTVGELALTEEGTEITIRRSPGKVLMDAPISGPIATGAAAPQAAAPRAPKVDKSVAINAPLTGVYYSAASPTTPDFVNIGDTIHVGQVVALIEAMKVFNEINAEISGRVVALPATSGAVVQKGDPLVKIEPL
ncbi:acetyl-CoA carboxylase, biotin carboxyl carrier protein [Dictyobacter alpinus]|uniref:Biotin carboxyl carrier protein of acetyl-CoA carboxylase n=1 Tax=Dictyobacter alpinus TaxID=2014873 RepID=A0A402B4L4_9CHLR|nr:biotin/lipoyl-containing protein [Dictyobacter alpinus]GCE26286.1 acetyl-CoA carboxylase, biotin carboxyl carrier protein [Dictyobacter alpinus]